MTLFGFCICINDEFFEAAQWGISLEEAFSYINDQHEWELMRPMDPSAEWEWTELALYDDGPSLVYWMGEAEA